MIRTFSIIIGIVVFGCTAVHAQDSTAQFLPIIPHPSSITTAAGSFEINSATTIVADLSNEDVKQVARYLQSLISNPTTWEINIQDINESDLIKTENAILLRIVGGYSNSTFDTYRHPVIINKDENQPNIESYSLNVQENMVQVTANHPMGLFFAVQTIRQLLP